MSADMYLAETARWGREPVREECPDCHRMVGLNRFRTALSGHYNPANPPIPWAWENCPGPTEEQKERAGRLAELYGTS